jgi:hypothetical protein
VIRWLRSVLIRFFGPPPDLASVVPLDPGQAHTLERADALLRHPVIHKLELSRQEAMRGSFRRTNQRLGIR